MSEHGRVQAAVAFALVFGALTVAVLLFLSWSDDERAAAHFPTVTPTGALPATPTGTLPAPHPGLDFSLSIDIASAAMPTPDLRTPFPKTTNICDTNGSTTPGSTCDLAVGSRFVVKVYLNSLGGVPSYEGFDIKLTYAGVTSKNVRRVLWWPDCVFAASFGSAGLETMGCGVGIGAPGSVYTGLLGTAEFNCAASGTMVLEHGDGETALTQTIGNVHGETAGSTETLTINCLVPPTPTHTRTPTLTPQFSPTPNLGPQMELGVQPAARVVCQFDDADGREECNVPFILGKAKRGQFTILVNPKRIPQGGYGGIQTEIELPIGLTWNPRSPCDEVVWPDADPATCDGRSVSAGRIIRHRATTDTTEPFDESIFDDGALVAIDVHCPGLAENLEVKLTDFSAYQDENGDEIATKLLEPPDMDDLFFNCIAPPPAMSLNATGPRVTCDDATKPTKCTAPVEATPVTFKLLVDANVIPIDGYGGFASEVFFGGLTYPTTRTCSAEVKWPEELLCFQIQPAAAKVAKHHLSKSALFAPLTPISTYANTLVELEVQCPREGQFLVQLPAHPARASGARYIDEDDLPVAVATVGSQNLDLNGDTVGEGTPVAVADALLINCQTLPTATATRTVTPTATPTCAAGPCPTATPTRTPTPTVTATPSPAASATPTRTPTPTVPPPPTATFTLTPAPTSSVSETRSEELFAPGKVTTDENPPDSASATDRVETNVTTVSPGRVTITEKGVTQQAPEGFSFLGEQVNISAPGAPNPQNPLTIIFVLDASVIPDGENEDTIAVFKDGMLVLNCLGPPGKASPDPCVSKRHLLTGGPTTIGDVQITVKTTEVSSWNFGVAGDIPPPGSTPTPTRTGGPCLLGDVNGDRLINSLDAWWVLLEDAGTVDEVPLPCAGDANQDGRRDARDALAILQFDAGIICCLPPPQSAGADLSPWGGLSGLRRWLLSR